MKTNIKLAWRNIWRNRRRTIITVASIFFGVLLSTFMTSMQEGTYSKMIDNVVGFYSGYIQIHHPDYWDNKTIDYTFTTIGFTDNYVQIFWEYFETRVFSQFWFGTEASQQRLGVTGHRCKGIVDFMCHTRSQKANTRHLFGLEQLEFLVGMAQVVRFLGNAFAHRRWPSGHATPRHLQGDLIVH